MTRKDYEAIARVFVESVENSAGPCVGLGGDEDPAWRRGYAEAVEDLARGIADVFASDNGRFQRERFYRAAGVEVR